MANYLNPNDDTVYKAFQKVDAEYLQRIPSVPTTLGDEFTWNPFLRTSQLTDGGSIKMRAEKLSELRKIKEAYMENRRTFDEEATEKRRENIDIKG
ncbi:unnamed protein product, partial [Mesorhabditis belari]|uniref:Hydroxyacylglutathione hydrolase C-terminal domain-containing protein n=1 Tax=Mesorhabditis belari TaxID=2138241 RepID=A0AAF3EAE6_9BILA